MDWVQDALKGSIWANLLLSSGQWIQIKRGDKYEWENNVLRIADKKGKRFGYVNPSAIDAIHVGRG